VLHLDRRRLALLALVTLTVVWGYNWVVMKIAVSDTAPFTFAAWRTFGGGVMLLVLALFLRRPLRPEFPVAYFWIGIFQTGGFIGLAMWAVLTAGAGKVALLAYTMPVWVCIMAWPALGERLHLPQTAAIAVAFAGVACLIWPLREVGRAEILALLAGLSWAIGIIITKLVQRGRRVDLYGMTMWQMLFGGAALVIVALAVPHRATTWSGTFVFALAYNIALATALGYALWVFVLDVLPARDASMGVLANPVVSIIAAWLQLGERPGVLTAVGAVLILAGLALLSFVDRQTKEQELRT
jgi:drug/metabolite transporter (DMT)-like permease